MTILGIFLGSKINEAVRRATSRPQASGSGRAYGVAGRFSLAYRARCCYGSQGACQWLGNAVVLGLRGYASVRCTRARARVPQIVYQLV